MSYYPHAVAAAPRSRGSHTCQRWTTCLPYTRATPGVNTQATSCSGTPTLALDGLLALMAPLPQSKRGADMTDLLILVAVIAVLWWLR